MGRAYSTFNVMVQKWGHVLLSCGVVPAYTTTIRRQRHRKCGSYRVQLMRIGMGRQIDSAAQLAI